MKQRHSEKSRKLFSVIILLSLACSVLSVSNGLPMEDKKISLLSKDKFLVLFIGEDNYDWHMSDNYTPIDEIDHEGRIYPYHFSNMLIKQGVAPWFSFKEYKKSPLPSVKLFMPEDTMIFIPNLIWFKPMKGDKVGGTDVYAVRWARVKSLPYLVELAAPLCAHEFLGLHKTVRLVENLMILNFSKEGALHFRYGKGKEFFLKPFESRKIQSKDKVVQFSNGKKGKFRTVVTIRYAGIRTRSKEPDNYSTLWYDKTSLIKYEKYNWECDEEN